MKKKYGLAPPPQQGVKKAAKPAAKPVTKKAAPKVVAKKAVAKKHVAKAAAKAVAKESTKPNVKPVDLASILVDTKNDVEKGTKLHDAYERRTAEAFKQDQENAVAKLTTDPNKLKAEFLKQTIDEITLNQKPKQEPKKMTVAQHIEQARAKRRHAAFFKPKGK